jgi:uncharacterized membrane protein YdjX (TVP38/TMEM64 family)
MLDVECWTFAHAPSFSLGKALLASDNPLTMTKANRAILLHSLSGLLLALVLAVAARWLPVAEYVTRAQRKITELELWGGVIYPMLFAACNVLLLPGGILAIGAGLFFGLWWGWLFNVVGSTLAAVISVSLARRWGRGWVQKRLHPNGRWSRLDAAVAREGPKIIFLSQVHPLFPTSLLNYLYGLTRVPVRTCVLWIALGQAPGMFLYAYLGRFAQSGLRAWRGESALHGGDWALWMAGLVALIFVTILLARVALRLLASMEEPALAGSEESDSSGSPWQSAPPPIPERPTKR